ncbi:hypothetical protein CPB84DRAFT_1817523 [Gymnopilus junonius]|uniref:Peptidase M3A/M3B catalytic domain-containing protein n=1 Tax=Gymnopilus junonius TaxID=109634 RepID=A0A9P5THG9_GYMJU|nr:hypothetical protein CPB84DRAFT_1817523 [Gymnopilus junonius]
MTLTPPQPPPALSIEQYKIVLDKVEALEPLDCNFEPIAITNAHIGFGEITGQLKFYKNVSLRRRFRDTADKAESPLDDFEVERSMRLDVFAAKVSAEGNIKRSNLWTKLSSEERRLVEKMVEKNGLSLPTDTRAELAVLKKELKQVCFGVQELQGIPQEELNRFTKSTEGDKDVYIVKFKGNDLASTVRILSLHLDLHLETRKILKIRKRAHEAQGARLAVNVPLFSRAMELRCKIATLLGYDTWADYVTEIKMAKSGKTQGDPFDGKFYEWDHGYHHFPVAVVVPVVLSIYKDLFSLKFEELNDASTWHPEKDAKDESGFLRYFYLDLSPRPGKYSHNAVWLLLEGHELPDKKRAYPVLEMVANLAKPTPEKPALIRYHDVWTFVHEMGLVFHSLLNKTQFARFHGFNVTYDFEEAPLLMLVDWCWEPKILEKLSSHYETKEPLSPELVEKLIKTRYMNTGLFYLHQVFQAKIKMVTLTLDPARGKRYRDIVRYPGGSRDEMEILQEFIGRLPNNEAFIRQILGTA